MLDPKVFETPMMQQYMKIKRDYADCLLFFRLGDFYEFFLEDAKIGAEVLDITLTSRSRGKDGRIPMAGIPYHAVDSYLSKLVKAGYKVAICEQVSEPSAGDLVEREVVRIVTPGTLLDQKALDRNKNNYVCSISFGKHHIGLAFVDVSTGDFQTAQVENTSIERVIADHFSRFSPVECILNEESYNNTSLLKILANQKDLNTFWFSNWDKYATHAKKDLMAHFSIKSLEVFNLSSSSQAVTASAVLLGYLKDTQKDKVLHIKKINSYLTTSNMEIGRSTIFNLELFSTIRDGSKRGSLLNVLDKTNTPMGARMLRHWVTSPLANKSEIIKRHDFVEELVLQRKKRENLKSIMEGIGDVERVLSRISVGLGNARDLIDLKDSLVAITNLKSNTKEFNSTLGKKLSAEISVKLLKVIEVIEKNILDEPPIELKQGGLIKKGVSSKLDLLNSRISGSKDWLVQLEEEERVLTKIPNLKVGFNKVYGYYIEITKSYLSMVPERYVRKQTLVNAERFITQRLKEEEELVLAASDEIYNLEYQIFLDVVKSVLQYTNEIQMSTNAVAVIDCLVNFAHIAEINNYKRPTFSTNGDLHIQEGRHPVVETLIEDKQFVPNDTKLNHKDQQLIILTGPNMAGKSVYIRQVALIVLMSQMGSFVPAVSATLPVVDKIFVRSGASDFITSGLSTFMVEMVETAQILNSATKDSLIVLDEIGRGTTTYDGVSIAWSIGEYLVKNKSPYAKTLFATHYHELQLLERDFKQVKNYQALVKETLGDPVFLHKIVSGGASHSYGVAVAKLAGLPEEVTTRAMEVLRKLEAQDLDVSDSNAKVNHTQSNKILGELLKDVNLEKFTPIEALNLLFEIRENLNAK